MIQKDLVVLFIQILTTWALLGIVWFIQLIFYPSFQNVKEGFVHYERRNLKRTTIFLAPIFIIDLVTNVLLLLIAKKPFYVTLISIALALNILALLLTFLFQMQQHQKLSVHFSKATLQKLVRVSLIRSLLWSAKAAVYFVILLTLY